MKSLEQGRKVLDYSINTGLKVVGVEGFQRGRRYAKDQHKEGISSIAYPIVFGFFGFFGSLTGKFHPNPELDANGKMDVNRHQPKGSDFIALGLDVTSLAIPLYVLFPFGYNWEAAVTKLGYNVIAQVAPDVAALAKRKVLHKTA